MVRFKMRPNIKETLKFTASKSEIPVDMYFLFDLSKTMEDTLKNLAKIAKDLASELAFITSDRNFGFGIFREKPTPPFDIYRDYQHDFEHHMKLTPNISEFSKKVADTVDIVGNIDNPEAGFDALMQVLLCPQDIGWRTGTTHIIVFISDATPHSAGDGILGGTWKSYEHSCQLQPKGNMMVYNSLEHDYPSFSAINYQMKKQEKFLILGLKSYIQNYYKELKRTSTLEASIGVIDSGKSASEALKNLILDKYRDIKGKLILESSSITPNVKVNLKSQDRTCKDKEEGGNDISCNKVSVGDKVSFEVEMELTEKACKSTTETFEVKVFGQENSKLRVTIEPDCICDCMKGPTSSRNDAFCTGHGKEQCGTCFCDEGFYGEKCECNAEESNSLNDSEGIEKCKSEDGLTCSSHGSCSCGTCQCTGQYIGKFCECNLQNCHCGEHGQCNTCEDSNLQCTCDDGWTLGSTGSCDCSAEQDNCLDPFTNTICNKKGKCECNQCNCDDSEGDFCQQPYAEEFTDVQERSCQQLAPCILLDTFGHILEQSDEDSTLSSELEKECVKTKLKIYDRLECFWALNGTEIRKGQLDLLTPTEVKQVAGTTGECSQNDADTTNLKQCTAWFKGCQFFFWHNAEDGVDGYTSNMEKIRVYLKYYNKTNNPLIVYNGDIDLEYELTAAICPSFVDKWIIISIVSGVVVFIFIVCFIAYIVLINLYDKWEYERFKQDAAAAWDIGNVQQNMIGEERPKSTFGDKIRNRMSRMSVRH